jgi:murein tripeptide amidase MpaA
MVKIESKKKALICYVINNAMHNIKKSGVTTLDNVNHLIIIGLNPDELTLTIEGETVKPKKIDRTVLYWQIG